MANAGDGDEVVIIGGGFSFNERARALLLAILPPVIHVPAAMAEAGATGPGGPGSARREYRRRYR